MEARHVHPAEIKLLPAYPLKLRDILVRILQPFGRGFMGEDIRFKDGKGGLELFFLPLNLRESRFRFLI